jgi:hypothetical protein
MPSVFKIDSTSKAILGLCVSAVVLLSALLVIRVLWDLHSHWSFLYYQELRIAQQEKDDAQHTLDNYCQSLGDRRHHHTTCMQARITSMTDPDSEARERVLKALENRVGFWERIAQSYMNMFVSPSFMVSLALVVAILYLAGRFVVSNVAASRDFYQKTFNPELPTHAKAA